MSKSFRFVLAAVPLVCLGLATAAIHPAYADDATDRARSHYEMGIQLFEGRQQEQALVEFQRAYELKPRPAAVFMMAQCEYLMGQLKAARGHYEQYVAQSPEGEFVELAKDRILAIERHPAVLVVNSAPDQVDIRVELAEGGKVVASGQAPNNFTVLRGKYVVVASKTNFVTERRVVDVDLAETKPLFFKLEPIPARLEIWTDPAGANLYVNGNRARNPFLQDVPPGKYEIYAEAPNYHARTEEFVIGPGQKKAFSLEKPPFTLPYVQRSGRPELVAASALMGSVWGLGAVFVMMNPDINSNDQKFPVTPLLGGAVSGAVAGGLIANAVLPSYIRDNRALWLIGGMGFGGAEGVGVGLLIGTWSSDANKASFAPALYGSLVGLAAGTTTAALLSDKAPNYGRVAMIESAGFGGALAGALVGVPLNSLVSRRTQLDQNGDPLPDNRYMVVKYAFPMLVGMNLGLAGGVAAAYLSDQKKYGPSWQRIVLVDLAAAAGALVGLTTSTLTRAECAKDLTKSNCGLDFPNSTRAAMFTLGGGVAGIVAGILLTRNFDLDRKQHSETSKESPSTSTSWIPVPSVMPVDTGRGMAAAPGFVSTGRF